MKAIKVTEAGSCFSLFLNSCEKVRLSISARNNMKTIYFSHRFLPWRRQRETGEFFSSNVERTLESGCLLLHACGSLKR